LVSSGPVQKLATPHKFTEAAPLSRERFPLAFVLSVLFLGALWFGLCRELSGEWSVNEQYSFGWFVPFFALCLFWLRWQDRPEIRSQKSEVRSRRTEGRGQQETNAEHETESREQKRGQNESAIRAEDWDE